MTIDEAITTLHSFEEEYLAGEELKAIQLGLEALEREKLYRQRLIELKAEKDIELLPSETEGEE